MTLADIKDLIGGVGFPIFVAVYLLFKMAPIIAANTAAITRLTDAVDKLCIKVGIDPPKS